MDKRVASGRGQRSPCTLPAPCPHPHMHICNSCRVLEQRICVYFCLCLCAPLHYARMHVQIRTCMHSHGELAREKETKAGGSKHDSV